MSSASQILNKFQLRYNSMQPFLSVQGHHEPRGYDLIMSKWWLYEHMIGSKSQPVYVTASDAFNNWDFK